MQYRLYRFFVLGQASRRNDVSPSDAVHGRYIAAINGELYLEPVLPGNLLGRVTSHIGRESPRCSRRMPSIRRSGSAAPQSN
jgi:hypothetical protein